MSDAEIDKELERKISYIKDNFLNEDRPSRETQIRVWRLADLYFDGVQTAFWDDGAKDYRTIDSFDTGTENDDDDPNYIINIYRAHLESIAAALSVNVPKTLFFPANSEIAEDVVTAKTYSKAAENVQRHNDAGKLLLQILYNYLNHGIVFAYNYNDADEKYGIHQNPISHMDQQTSYKETCDMCGEDFENEAPLGACPTCASKGQQVPMQAEESVEPIEVVEGYEPIPKTREKIEIYGPLYVRVPQYIKKLEDSPFLILEFEQHYTKARATYPDFADRIVPQDTGYERWVRASTQLGYTYDTKLVTVQKCWFRPETYYLFSNEDAQELQKQFPDGVRAEFVNDILVAVESEKLDEHWTCTENPLSPKIHAVSIGQVIKPIQQLTNEMTNLTIQTIEHGIPQIFMDARLVDINTYTSQKQKPGTVWPTRAIPGVPLEQAVTQVRTATLSDEVGVFARKLEEFGQFLSGDFPSIYGGPIEGGSQTAREYEKSSQQALQRLSIIYKIIRSFWSRLIGKATTSYIKNLVSDDSFVSRSGEDFTSVWIRRSEATGKVGEVEPESSDELPISWQEKKANFYNLLQTGQPALMSALFSPINIELVSRLVGMSDFNIPGANDRLKQLMEISELLRSQPAAPQGVDPMGQPLPPIPSVPIEPEVDNDQIHLMICQDWLNSLAGQTAKTENPGGYANVTAHYMQHVMRVKMTQAPPAPANGENSDGGRPPGPVGP